MTEASRWIVAVIAVVAIAALVLFARGGAERSNPEATPSAVAIEAVA